MCHDHGRFSIEPPCLLAEEKKHMEKIQFKEVTVCEDESRAYDFWKKHVNHNPDDCCNLRRKR